MQIEIDDSVVKLIGIVTGIISSAFAVFFLMNALHVENHELELTDSQIRQRILISESTRYGEIVKYYQDLSKERDLTLAEMERLRLVEKQQCRISNTLNKNTQSEYFIEELKECSR